MNLVNREQLDLFLKLKSDMNIRFKSQFTDIDKYGFYLGNKTEKIKLFITALTHGNEVIGLEIVNKILEKIMLHNGFSFSIGFLLNNVDSFLEDKRYLDFDLNRSFGSENVILNKEYLRSIEIKDVISSLNIKVLVDLHQTIEPTLQSFSMIPEHTDLINLSKEIIPEFPVVCFSSEGFSKQGKTLIEYTNSINISSIVYEIGQKGYNDSLSTNISEYLMAWVCDQHSNNTKANSYYFITEYIPNEPGTKLIEGFKNWSAVSKDQILTSSTDGEITCKSINEGYILFPRYKNVKEKEPFLGLILTEKPVKDSRSS